MTITLSNLHKATDESLFRAAAHIAQERAESRKENAALAGNPNATERRWMKDKTRIHAIALCLETLRAKIYLKLKPEIDPS